MNRIFYPIQSQIDQLQEAYKYENRLKRYRECSNVDKIQPSHMRKKQIFSSVRDTATM